ncbi:MAG: hypothetical protein AABZ73_04665 [Pseudomonadota bacterium]|uniref:hypothetical protein n=2 Tax=Sphingobium sp. TaxID=1912891 RepID=UPI002E2224D2
MEMQRKPFGRSANGHDMGHARIVNVGLPKPYEGVGNALRATFSPAREALPDDIMALLARLDTHQ